MPADGQLDSYLRPTPALDTDHPRVIAFAQQAAAGRRSAAERAAALFFAVRDGIRYHPYDLELTAEAMRASAVLARGHGFCVAKAVVLAAAARVLGIPSRLGFADVKNHLATEHLRRSIGTDLFAFHGYTELLVDGAWRKATPAFDRGLCERLRVDPLVFDGHRDAMLQQFDREGQRYLEYVRDRGHFADLPLGEIRDEFARRYPALLARRTAAASTTDEPTHGSDTTP